MKREVQHVPYGYDPQATIRRGTLVYYDSFEHTTDEELRAAAQAALDKNFSKLVLYPLHEETVRRMSKEPASSYYKREDRLHEWKREQGASYITVENLEGKRKKYTPIDSALRHLTERYPAPHFLYLTPEMANQFASFSSFEEWIKKLRLLLPEAPSELQPRLKKFRHRWSIVGEENDKE